MCGCLPFSTEYNSGVPGPQGAGAAPTLQCVVFWTKFSSLHIFIVSMTSPGTGDLGTWGGNVNFELAEK